MGRFFISYRREDAPYAGWLTCLIGRAFGDERLFIDVESLRAGQNWENEIDQALDACDAVVLVIGPALAGRGEHTGPPLSRPDDWVRREIEHALSLQPSVPVMPVRVGGVTLRAEDLPESLLDLKKRQWIDLDDRTFRHDAQPLIKALDEVPRKPGEPTCTLEPVWKYALRLSPCTGGDFAFLWLDHALPGKAPEPQLAAADRPHRWIGVYEIPVGRAFRLLNDLGAQLDVEVLRPNVEPAQTVLVWTPPTSDSQLETIRPNDLRRRLLPKDVVQALLP